MVVAIADCRQRRPAITKWVVLPAWLTATATVRACRKSRPLYKSNVKLGNTFGVRLFGFAQTTTPLDSLDEMPPPGPQTRIGDSLVQVLQTAGSVPLAGIVLVSDGAENGGTLSEERLAEIASFGVPMHTVGVGPEQIANDLELERARCCRRAPAVHDRGSRHPSDGAAQDAPARV